MHQQVLMPMSEIEQIELAGIVFCGAKGKTELAAKRRVLIIDLTCHGNLGFNEDSPPEGDGDSAEHYRQNYDHGRKSARRNDDNVAGQPPRLPFCASPWRYYQASRAFCARSCHYATLVTSRDWTFMLHDDSGWHRRSRLFGDPLPGHMPALTLRRVFRLARLHHRQHRR